MLTVLTRQKNSMNTLVPNDEITCIMTISKDGSTEKFSLENEHCELK